MWIDANKIGQLNMNKQLYYVNKLRLFIHLKCLIKFKCFFLVRYKNYKIY